MCVRVQVQFHDWHSTLSLLYLPPDVSITTYIAACLCRDAQTRADTFRLAWRCLSLQVMPEVLLVLHNAHYNGTFPCPDPDRQTYVYR